MSAPASNTQGILTLEKKQLAEQSKKTLTSLLSKMSLDTVNLERKLELLQAIQNDGFCDHLTFNRIKFHAEDLLDIILSLKTKQNIRCLNFCDYTILKPTTEAELKAHHDTMQKLAKAFESMPHVISLKFEDCDIDTSWAKWVSSALINNTVLKQFYLAPKSKYADLNLSILFRMLQNHASIDTLTLRHVYLDKEETSELIKIVLLNKSITSILLIDYEILSGGNLIAFFTALSHNKTIQRLQLRIGELDLEEITELAKSLKDNDCLTELGLIDCTMSDDEAKHLCEALATNKTLRKLNISKNESIKAHGLKAFANYLPHSHLQCLDIRGCSIRQPAAMKLIAGFAANEYEFECLKMVSDAQDTSDEYLRRLTWAKFEPSVLTSYNSAIETNRAKRSARLQKEWTLFVEPLSRDLPTPLLELIWSYHKTKTDFNDKTLSDCKSKGPKI